MRHEGVQQGEELRQHSVHREKRDVLGDGALGHAASFGHAFYAQDVGLRRFHEPVAVVAPEKVVEPLRRLVEAIFLVGRFHGDLRVAQLGLDVEDVRRGPVADARATGQRRLLHLVEAGGVPDLVGEVAAFRDLFFIEAEVLPHRGDAQQAEAHPVCAVVGHELEHVGRIAFVLAHLVALGVADQAGETHVAERDVVRHRLRLARLEL